jgi:hypothetical protein
MATLFMKKPKPIFTEGPRINDLSVTTSTEGAPISSLYGRMRPDGQILWATQFNEKVNTETTKTKTGGKGGSPSQTTVNTTYTYSRSFAVGFCAGNSKAALNRVWADGKEIDLSTVTFRFYSGSQTQTADPKIQAIEGAANVPAYRGVCYLVFDDLQLESFGNRIPQITAEVVVPLATTDADDLTNIARAVTLIPGSGETVYGTQAYSQQYTQGETLVSTPDNVHNSFRKPDAVLSLDNLFNMCDNLDAVSLVVSWFATDLRAGSCRIIPKREDATRSLSPNQWQVESYTRATATNVSLDEQGRPNFGGTPDDTTVKEMIAYIKSKGKRVVFYPFVMCDIPGGNTLPNPYSNNAAGVGQAVFPWRGRITCSPAPGYTGTVDLTAAAATQINTFFTQAEGFRRMILHYANLCVAAGGVDAFIIGSELIGITTVRSAAGVYPGVSALVTLAADVRAIFVGAGQGSTKIGYAADWSEWTHESASGTYFHLDPLWASSSIDFCGVDNYLPLSDWRDGAGHLDYNAVSGPTSEYDLAYLASQIEGGEYFNYYYANATDRTNQVRTPITDGTYGKPWVFRRKDFRSWWSNLHYNRPGGVESGSPTAWTPYSKPIWFTEFGCPAVDKGTNQPNVFYDPKSSESTFPYFSRGVRDDFIARVYQEVMLKYWRDSTPVQPGVPTNKMLQTKDMYIWTWDARPYPDYPARSNVWSDGALWFYGHWLNGRIDAVPLARLVAYFCQLAGLTPAQYDVTGLFGPGGLVRGFNIDEITSLREMIISLAKGHLFDSFESDGKIKFVLRSNARQVSIPSDNFVISDNDVIGAYITRGQETELPTSIKIKFIDEFNSYQSVAVDGKTAKGYSQNVDSIDLPEVLTENYVRSLADSLVQQAWIERERGEVNLPPSYVWLEPGDAMTLPFGSRNVDVRIQQINTGDYSTLEFKTFDLGVFALPPSNERNRTPPVANLFGAVAVEWIDLPMFSGQEPLPWAPRVAAHGLTWPGTVAIYRQLANATFEFSTTIDVQSVTGVLSTPLYNGPVNRWDRGNTFIITLENGALSSIDEATMLQSALALAVQNIDGDWEVLQFATATLQSQGVYLISNLLRGQLGTETAMRSPVAAGARVVLIEPGKLTPLNVTDSLAATPIVYRWGPGPYPQTDVTYQQGTRSGKRIGLRPYSPCNVKIHRKTTNDLVLAWQRRTRFNGDAWAIGDVPLNEEFEQYKVQIYNGVTLVREAVTTTPTYTYTTANQVLDFGANQTALDLRIQQFGPAYGDYGPAISGVYNFGSSD